MGLDFLDQPLDVVHLSDVGGDADCSAFEAFAGGELVESVDGLVDAFFAGGFAGCDEDCFGAGEEDGGCGVEA